MNKQIPITLLEMIRNGESATVEFKEANKCLPKSLFESICGMLNRNGGNIFLGINDSGEILGVDKNCIKEMRKNFASLCNNSEKIFPTVRLEINEYTWEDKHILYIYVYESSDVHKTRGKIFDRNEDGDFDITANTSLVSNLYIRKSGTYIENTVYPYVTLNELRKDLIDMVRQMAINRTSNHPWAHMTDFEMLKSASLYEKNWKTGEEGFNLACILLFGKDEVIHSVLSYYKTDAILRVVDKDRYDDRDDIRTNLLDSYKRLTSFIKKHLNDKFYIDGDQRISVRDVIARELCVNLLIHREYSNSFPAKLIINDREIITENANKPQMIGYIDLENYSPYPKNPKIANIFKEIGLADEFGSGIRKMTKYTKIYSGQQPSFRDDDIFKVCIPLVKQYINGITNEELNVLILDFIRDSNGRTRQEINDYIYASVEEGKNQTMDNRIRTSLSFLKRNGFIKNMGSDTKSLWISL